MSQLKRKNPSNMPAPVGNYSHVTVVPKEGQLVTFSGQIGTDHEGMIPESQAAQVTNTFKNLERALASEKLTADNVIKVNIWAVDELDWEHFYQLWDRLFTQEPPSMTVAYVKALGLPELQIEIEMWAVKLTE